VIVPNTESSSNNRRSKDVHLERRFPRTLIDVTLAKLNDMYLRMRIGEIISEKLAGFAEQGEYMESAQEKKDDGKAQNGRLQKGE
jgi:hypothetical protein